VEHSLLKASEKAQFRNEAGVSKKVVGLEGGAGSRVCVGG
jgi:hypothetical protein